MEGGFDHSNEVVWSTSRLLARLAGITLHLDAFKLTQRQVQELDHETDCIQFELKSREQDFVLFEVEDE